MWALSEGPVAVKTVFGRIAPKGASRPSQNEKGRASGPGACVCGASYQIA